MDLSLSVVQQLRNVGPSAPLGHCRRAKDVVYACNKVQRLGRRWQAVRLRVDDVGLTTPRAPDVTSHK